jgi:hypothetical protein
MRRDVLSRHVTSRHVAAARYPTPHNFVRADCMRRDVLSRHVTSRHVVTSRTQPSHHTAERDDTTRYDTEGGKVAIRPPCGRNESVQLSERTDLVRRRAEAGSWSVRHRALAASPAHVPRFAPAYGWTGEIQVRAGAVHRSNRRDNPIFKPHINIQANRPMRKLRAACVG